MAGYLEKAGHTVRCVPNGREALSVLMASPPDLILLDVLMPGMDGLEVLSVMRSYLKWATVPVAILTAYPEDPRLWHVAELGVTRVFTKSKVRLEEVLEWVGTARGTPPPGQGLSGPQAGV